jgi:formamidopyrimidine-DNA glycosylase
MEGPQVKALADRLGKLAVDQRVDRIDVPADRWQANVLLKHCAGKTVKAVRSIGQWLIWDFSHGISWVCFPLRSWRWSIEAAGQNAASFQPLAPRAGRRPLLTLTFPNGDILTLSGRPIFLVLMTEAVFRHPSLRDLGPDIFDPQLTIPQWAERVRGSRPRYISQALMNPAIACGIGNSLKCETLFTAHLHPAARVSFLSNADLQLCLQTARELAGAAYRRALGQPFPLHDHPRVYDRAGEPCDSCGTPIEVNHSGRDGHWSWFCPICQAPPDEPTLFGKLPFSQRGMQFEHAVRKSTDST